MTHQDGRNSFPLTNDVLENAIVPPAQGGLLVDPVLKQLFSLIGSEPETTDPILIEALRNRTRQAADELQVPSASSSVQAIGCTNSSRTEHSPQPGPGVNSRSVHRSAPPGSRATPQCPLPDHHVPFIVCCRSWRGQLLSLGSRRVAARARSRRCPTPCDAALLRQRPAASRQHLHNHRLRCPSAVSTPEWSIRCLCHRRR